MNDKDIIRCLRHCNGGDCETCKALGACDATWKFHKAALDLINRQKSEIETLQKRYDLAVAEREANVKGFAEQLSTIRAEVVRCKNCVLRGREDCAMYYRCSCGEQHTWETDNDFCSCGERKK